MSATLLLLATLLAAPAPAATPAADAGSAEVQPLHLAARALPDRVKLGEPFIYELAITHTPDQRYELKTPKDVGAFELLGQERQRTDASGSATTVFKVKLALFELGKHKLPDLSFEVADAAGIQRYTAPGIEVEAVSSLPTDAADKGEALLDIKPPEDVPVRSWRLLYWLAGLLAAGALAYAFYRYRQRPRPARPVLAGPPVPLAVRTRRALEALAAEDLPGQGRIREFYFRLSDVLRGYLGERYQFEALECTSAELMGMLSRMYTPGLPLEGLRSFVQESDLVKFAKLEMSPEACKAALDFGFLMLERTAPAPVPTPVEAHARGPHPS